MRRKLAGSRRALQHDLVDLAQLGEREGRAEERVRELGVLDLRAQAPERVLDDAVVVEREPGHRVGRHPAHVRADRRLLGLVALHERPVHDRDDAFLGRAVDVAEGVELLEVVRREAGGGAQRARGGGLERFVRRQPAAGQRPEPALGFTGAAHEGSPEHGLPGVVGAQGEDHGRDREAHGCTVLMRHPITSDLRVRMTRTMLEGSLQSI